MSAGHILKLGLGAGSPSKVLTLGYGVGPELPSSVDLGGQGAGYVPPETMLEVAHASVLIRGGGRIVVAAHKVSEQPSPEEQLFTFLTMTI